MVLPNEPKAPAPVDPLLLGVALGAAIGIIGTLAVTTERGRAIALRAFDMMDEYQRERAKQEARAAEKRRKARPL